LRSFKLSSSSQTGNSHTSIKQDLFYAKISIFDLMYEFMYFLKR